MTNEKEHINSQHQEIEPKPLPRWVTVTLGLLLVPFTLICVVGSATLVIDPNVPRSILTTGLGSLFLIGSLWVFYLSLRLIFSNPKSKRKFVSPIALRLIAMVFLAIPLLSLYLGTFWEKPVVHSLMTIGYLGVALRLWELSKYRENA